MSSPIVYKTDVLVVGGGFSGSWAALTAAATARDVLIVDKAARDWRGLGMMSGGDMIVMQPEFHVEDLLDEMVYYYDGLCDQPLVRKILEHSYERFCDLERWGHIFARDENGKLRFVVQRGLKYMRYYLYHPYGKGGPHTCNTLYDQLSARGVRRMSNIQLVKLIKRDGRVVGAAGFHTRSGLPCVIKAGAVVLCTNTGGFKMSYLSNTSCGEGALLGYEAGAEFQNMEFLQNWTCPVAFAWEGQTGMLPHGARFVNNKGEDFMKKYSPLRGAKADPHYNIRGMVLETRAGNGPTSFDTSTMTEEGVRVMTPTGGWMLLNSDKLKALGIDFFHQKTEWMPQFHYVFGGMKTSLDGNTGVPGLYAAGRASSLHTGVYMGGWDTCMTSTTGCFAGEAAAREAMDTESGDFSVDDALEEIRPVTSKLGKSGILPKDVVRSIQELMVPEEVSVLKTGHGLNRALHTLEKIRDEYVPEMAAQDPHYLMKLMEARGMTLVAEMYLRASLARKESRCGHFREDYPLRGGSPEWIRVRRGEGGMHLSYVAVPIGSEGYPVRPYRYYMDDFDYPDQPKSL
ncbi:FAD-dependent oxidoreductase [Mailhella massiliensis]|uniref:FAD-dependent oxidoreductase n=1 Tax=Mailhella massiliensis TaxID=1903261 RepID=UPI00097D5455|nr:FAD-binding protein [Mailhella massiliensis]